MASGNVGVGSDPDSSLEVLPLVVDLLLPTSVDCIRDNIPVAARDIANEKHFNVVLHGNELGVVNSGLLGKLLAFHCNFYPGWREAQLRLSTE